MQRTEDKLAGVMKRVSHYVLLLFWNSGGTEYTCRMRPVGYPLVLELNIMIDEYKACYLA
jgi:hypothetical protein